ncbi:hypothetical protein FB451DRAFT_1178990 [Mycena latifolia]|nr:hypothetical protein FB451DRAFT_1178990 [Mycena latifolia]
MPLSSEEISAPYCIPYELARKPDRKIARVERDGPSVGAPEFLVKDYLQCERLHRSWAWLGMISVSIFALRDVIRRVQLDYKIPFNGKSHTNPSKIQSFWPERDNNDCPVPARDLMEIGAAYANAARAFKTFRADTRKASNSGTKNGVPLSEGHNEDLEEEEGTNYDNYGEDLELDLGDLGLDSEEFPTGIVPSDFVAMAKEALRAMDDLELE